MKSLLTALSTLLSVFDKNILTIPLYNGNITDKNET